MLNKSSGNMYEFVTHTWNTVKGECYHDCSYCYMKRWGKLNPVRFDEKELKTNLGKGNFIFIGSGVDLFSKEIPEEWILKTLKHCENFDSKFLFQTKNPNRFWDYIDKTVITDKSVLCITLESNREYPEIMRNSPTPKERVLAMSEISKVINSYVTIEPILDFDLEEFVIMLKEINPMQINIGADSGNHKLPEPSKEKIEMLIEELKDFSVVKKKNLSRLLK